MLVICLCAPGLPEWEDQGVLHEDAGAEHEHYRRCVMMGRVPWASVAGCGTDYGCSDNCEFSYCEYISLVSFFT